LKFEYNFWFQNVGFFVGVCHGHGTCSVVFIEEQDNVFADCACDMMYREDDNCQTLQQNWTAILVCVPVSILVICIAVCVRRRYATPLKEAKKALKNNQVRSL
jgi:hypothetical protein